MFVIADVCGRGRGRGRESDECALKNRDVVEDTRQGDTAHPPARDRLEGAFLPARDVRVASRAWLGTRGVALGRTARRV